MGELIKAPVAKLAYAAECHSAGEIHHVSSSLTRSSFTSILLMHAGGLFAHVVRSSNTLFEIIQVLS